MLVKIDGKMKTQMTKDWLVEFPEYKKFATTNIKKRVGPLLCGVWYEILTGGTIRVNSSYFNLANENEFIFANLKTIGDSYSYAQHEKGKYKNAALDLKERSPIALEGPVTLSDIITGYRKYERRMCTESYEDPALIAAWCGKEQLAKDVLDEFLDLYKSAGNYPHGHWNSFDEWYTHMLFKISNPKALRDTVDRQIEKFKLQKLPIQELIIDL